MIRAAAIALLAWGFVTAAAAQSIAPGSGSAAASLPVIGQTQAAFSSVSLSSNPTVTTLTSGLALTLGTSNGPNGNWRVYVRVKGTIGVTAGANTNMTRIAVGITSTTTGSSAFKTASHGDGTFNSNFTNCIADTTTIVQGFTGDAIQNGFLAEYVATYANGASLTFNAVAVPSSGNADTNLAAGFLEVYAVPQ